MSDDSAKLRLIKDLLEQAVSLLRHILAALTQSPRPPPVLTYQKPVSISARLARPSLPMLVNHE